MTDQREVFDQSPLPPPPYADPVIVLAPQQIFPTFNGIRPDVSIQRMLERYFSSFLFFIWFFYMIAQIVLACFSCSLPASNLGWIRASFFLNTPCVLIVCIYLYLRLRANGTVSLKDFRNGSALYAGFFTMYLFTLGIFVEIHEFGIIRETLNNATLIDSLPCSAGYYENVIRLKISQYCLPIPLLILLCSFCCHIPSASQKAFVKQRYNQLISFVVNRWRHFADRIFQRHPGEVFLPRD